MTRVSIHKLSLFAILLISRPVYLLAQEQLLVPQNHTTIQAAIDAAAVGDTVLISPRPDAYAENLTIDKDIELRGSETARVILESAEEGDAGTILTVTGVGDVTIRNLTFKRGGIGVLINTSLGVKINNSVFALSDNATAIEISDLNSEVFIRNNTFSGNNIAIRSNAAANIVTVENNIFSDNTTTLESGLGIENAGSNCYATDENQIDGEDPTPAVVGNVGFDNPAALDFHLTAVSDCIDLGPDTDAIDDTDSDAGTYGGQLADPNPFPPQNLESTPDDDPADYSILLEWRANNSYLFKYYKVYYGSEESGVYNGDDAEDDTGALQPSPINVGNSTSITLHNLSGPATPPEAPVLSPLVPSSGQIRVNWAEVANADAYILHWGIDSTDENRVEAGSETGYTLTGLENGTRYQVEVSALKQARYYLAVSTVATSLIDNPDNEEIESAQSDELTQVIGPQLESIRSNTESIIPEEVVPFPNLPDQGDKRCFIATSAYSSNEAPEITALRRFRDDYLLPHASGRRLVAAYYQHSPALAERLDRHPALKPVVRMLLMPVVWLANSLP
jgi:hypothetical protein